MSLNVCDSIFPRVNVCGMCEAIERNSHKDIILSYTFKQMHYITSSANFVLYLFHWGEVFDNVSVTFLTSQDK